MFMYSYTYMNISYSMLPSYYDSSLLCFDDDFLFCNRFLLVVFPKMVKEICVVQTER